MTGLNNLNRLARERPVLTILASIGSLWASNQLLSVASFIHLHFLRRSGLHLYKDASAPNSSWALVSGSSDGIGRGFVEELCSQGFNVVLHGRNEKKLQGVKDDLLKEWPDRQVRLLVLDAGNDTGDAAKMQAAADQLNDISLRLLVNNVAGFGNSGPDFCQLSEHTAERVSKTVDISARFHAEITRVLLPNLMRKPSAILNIGSGISQFPAPFVSVYAGCKAFLMAFSNSLNAEMKIAGHRVESKALLVGMVATPHEIKKGRKVSLAAPSSRAFARSCLNVLGSGYDELWAYWPHALQFGLITSMPIWLRDNIIHNMMKKELFKGGMIEQK